MINETQNLEEKVEHPIDKAVVQMNTVLYHGSPVPGIAKLDPEHKVADSLGDYMGSCTLGYGIYTTDSERMAVNYGFYRHSRNEDELKKDFGIESKPVVYQIKLKNNLNQVVNLDCPEGVEALMDEFYLHSERVKDQMLERWKTKSPIVRDDFKNIVNIYPVFHKNVKDENKKIKNLRLLAEEFNDYSSKNYDVSICETNFIRLITEILKERGINGMICTEGGEGARSSVYDWEPCKSYLIFNNDAIETVSEDHYGMDDGKPVLKSRINRQEVTA